MSRTSLWLTFVAALLAAASCSDDATVATGSASSDVSLPKDDPVVVFVSPSNGDTFPFEQEGVTITVRLEVLYGDLGESGDSVAISVDGVQSILLDTAEGEVLVEGLGLHTLEAQVMGPSGVPYSSAASRDTVQVALVAPCAGDGDCDDDNPCSADACDAGTCAYVSVANGCCVSASDCKPGQSCLDNQCLGGGTPGGILCKTDDDCEGALGPIELCMREACGDEGICVVERADGAACDDGDPCTEDGHCLAGACEKGAAVSCDDQDPCTDDSCGAAGCEHSPNAAPCDDGDECTVTDVCSDGACVGTGVAPGCTEPPPQATICGHIGDLGSDAACPLELLRTGDAVPLPVAAQLTVEYDSEAMELVRFEDTSCLGGPCGPKPTPPAPLWPSGHSVTMLPADPAGWDGKGSLVIVNIADPQAAISEAVLAADGTVVGDPVYITAVFRAKTEGSWAPKLTNVVVSDATSTAIPSTVDGLRILAGEPVEPPSGGPVCTLSGSTGETVDCLIRLAASSEAGPLATALEMKMGYAADLLSFEGFFGEICFEGVGCFEQAVGGKAGQTLATGHSVNTAPIEAVDWKGSGAVILVNLADTSKPITEAWLSPEGTVVGEPGFMVARFTLLLDVPVGPLATINLTSLVASDSEAATLKATVKSGVIVTSPL